MSIHFRDFLDPSWFIIQEQDLIHQFLFQYSTKCFVINPTLSGPSSTFNQVQLDTNFGKTFSSVSSFSVTASSCTSSEWSSAGWTVANQTTFKSELTTWVTNNLVTGLLADWNTVVMFGNLGGIDYVTVFVYPGNQDSSIIVSEVQNISFSGVPTSGYFKLTFSGQQTGELAFDITSSALKTALEALPNITEVSVSGNVTDGFDVTFVDPSTAALMTVTADTLSYGGVAEDSYRYIWVSGDPTANRLCFFFETPENKYYYQAYRESGDVTAATNAYTDIISAGYTVIEDTSTYASLIGTGWPAITDAVRDTLNTNLSSEITASTVIDGDTWRRVRILNKTKGAVTDIFDYNLGDLVSENGFVKTFQPYVAASKPYLYININSSNKNNYASGWIQQSTDYYIWFVTGAGEIDPEKTGYSVMVDISGAGSGSDISDAIAAAFTSGVCTAIGLDVPVATHGDLSIYYSTAGYRSTSYSQNLSYPALGFGNGTNETLMSGSLTVNDTSVSSLHGKSFCVSQYPNAISDKRIFIFRVNSGVLPAVWFFRESGGNISNACYFNGNADGVVNIVDILSTDNKSAIASKLKTSMDANAPFMVTITGAESNIVNFNYTDNGSTYYVLNTFDTTVSHTSPGVYVQGTAGTAVTVTVIEA